MLTISNLTRTLAASALVAYAALAGAQTGSLQKDQSLSPKSLPQFPASNLILQAALNDFSRCIDSSAATSLSTQITSAATDLVISTCAIQQAQLKQMLPADAYDTGMMNTRQRVAEVLAGQQASQTSVGSQQ